MYVPLCWIFVALSVISLLEDSNVEAFTVDLEKEEEEIAIISRSFDPETGLDNVGGRGYRRKKKKMEPSNVLGGKSNGYHEQKMKIFAVATDTTNENFLMFNTSAQQSGLVVHLLGVGDAAMKEVPLSENEKLSRKTRHLPFHSRANFGRKILHFHKALLKIEDVDTFVILVDAYDSIFLSSLFVETNCQT